jgi:hypothetical protein
LQRRRHLQKVLFPSGVHFDGEGFGTPVTCLFFKDLEAESGQETQMESPTGTTWNPLIAQLTAFETLKNAHL